MFNYKKFNEINNLIKNKGISSKIIAISKNHPVESIKEAIKFGVSIFGENRVQEAQEKFIEIIQNNPNIKLHLTGPLQSNKVKQAIKIFDVFHTLDREKIAREFSKHYDLLEKKKFFVQVNTGREKTKSGIFPNDLKDFLVFLKEDLNLIIDGLMCIPPIDEDPKNHFNLLKMLAIQNNIKNLSIGMSADYEKALEFNPAFIRLGTILFGKR